MQVTFEQTSRRITEIIGEPIAPGRWHLSCGNVKADDSSSCVVVLLAANGRDALVFEVRTTADVELLGEALVGFVLDTVMGGEASAGHHDQP